MKKASSGENAPDSAAVHFFVKSGGDVTGDTIANTSDPTDFASSLFTIPGRLLQTGSRLSILARGVWSSAASDPSMTTDLVFDTSATAAVSTTGSLLQSPSVSNQGWEVNLDIICRVPGENGSAYIQGYRIVNTGARSSQREDMEDVNPIFWNTDLPVDVSLRQTWSVASATNSIEMNQLTVGLWGPA